MFKRNGWRVKNRWYNGWVHTADLELKDGNRDTIVKWIYDSELVPWYVTYLLEKYIDDDDVQDIIGELYLIICEISQERWDKVYIQGKMCVSAYVTGIIRQQVISTNSKIYNLINKRKLKEVTKSDEFWNRYYEEN